MGDSGIAGDSRRALTGRLEETMARTAPIPAGQPRDAARTAAGQVLTLAVGEVVAVQVAASVTLAALLWPLIPAARAVAGLAGTLGQRLPLRPPPEREAGGPAGVVVVVPGSGGGAGRAAAAPGGRRGAVRAAGPVTLGVEEEFVLLDPSATWPASRTGTTSPRREKEVFVRRGFGVGPGYWAGRPDKAFCVPAGGRNRRTNASRGR